MGTKLRATITYEVVYEPNLSEYGVASLEEAIAIDKDAVEDDPFVLIDGQTPTIQIEKVEE